MATEQDLKQVTKDFFDQYWNQQNGDPPEWGEHWYFDGTIPNHDKRGCYALYAGENIIYIGSGLGKSFGIYEGSGLGDRLKAYWQLNKDKQGPKKYKPTDKWEELNLTSIQTIGFDEKHYWLAAALEIFLIERLRPKRNVVHK